MIDEGETDWKVIAINVDDPDAANYNGKEIRRVRVFIPISYIPPTLPCADRVVSPCLQTVKEWGSQTSGKALLFLLLNFNN